jgi:DNA polymerase elongation subunit (family B)
MIIDIQQKEALLSISYIGESGDLRMMDLPIPNEEQYIWKEANPGQKAHPTIKSWDNKPVKKTRSKYLNKFRIEEFLLEQPTYIQERLHATNDPKMFFCDIEVEVTDDGFPHPHLANNPVTAIAFCTGTTVKVLGTKKLAADQIKRIETKINKHFEKFYKVDFNYYFFKSEYDMLFSFFSGALHKMPLITGWNFVGFDWPYLINRCKRLGIDPGISSPSGKLITKKQLPQHRMVVDYLQIYKTWDRTVDVKENNSLDFVSKAVLGVNKIKYGGTLQDLYEQDFEEYIFYNAVDTLLVQFIHEKIKTMQTFLTLARITKVEAQRAFSPIWMAESAMTREFYKRGKVFPKLYDDNKKREKFEGAFVFKPIPGIYEWVAAFDFASLYPSIMRQWNISPENYVKNTTEDIDPDKFIKTSTGAVFSNDEDSAFRTILTDYYGQRKKVKKEMLIIEKEIGYLKEYIT